MRPSAVVGVSFVVGALPSSNIAARWRAHVDLRDVDKGTVSGTSLYRVAGFGPLAISGIVDITKGMTGPLLGGRNRPVLAAVAGGAVIAGHNWSPFLRGAGGRGFAPALGVLGVQAWPGVPVLLGGLVAGRAFRQTGLGGFIAQCGLVPVLARTHGAQGAFVGACVVAPMWAKRVAGNTLPQHGSWHVYLHRLLFDCDPASNDPPT